jgi:creatinine amidohydrolase
MQKKPHIRYERAFPHEWRQMIEICPVAYLAVGPLEWHGEHLAFGCDPLRAKTVIEKVWRQIGGILMPPLYLGTDSMAAESGGELWGMEMFARERLPGTSFLTPDLFQAVVGQILYHLERQGIRLAVLYTGHLAALQIEIFIRIEKEFSGRKMRVLAWHMKRSDIPAEIGGDNINHASCEETSELMSIDRRLVDLSRAGSVAADRRVGLKPDITAKADPQLGKKRLDADVKSLVKAIRSTGIV